MSLHQTISSSSQYNIHFLTKGWTKAIGRRLLECEHCRKVKTCCMSNQKTGACTKKITWINESKSFVKSTPQEVVAESRSVWIAALKQQSMINRIRVLLSVCKGPYSFNFLPVELVHPTSAYWQTEMIHHTRVINTQAHDTHNATRFRCDIAAISHHV